MRHSTLRSFPLHNSVKWDAPLHVAHNECTILHGSKLPTDHLWLIATPTVPLSTPTANAAHALPSDAEFAKFTHAALGSPAISTLTQAVRCGYLQSYPGLTPAILTAHTPNSIATAKGQGQWSTQAPLVMFDTEESDEPDIDSSPARPADAINRANTQS